MRVSWSKIVFFMFIVLWIDNCILMKFYQTSRRPPQRRSCKRELAFFRSWIRENEKSRSWIRENDFVRDSWKQEIWFVNSWKLKHLFVNSWTPKHLWFVIRELTKSCSWYRETLHFFVVREFVKMKKIVREFVNRAPPGGASWYMVDGVRGVTQ